MKRSVPNRPPPTRPAVAKPMSEEPPLVRMDELSGEELRDPTRLLSCIASIEYTHRREMKKLGERLTSLQKQYDHSQARRISADRALLDCMVDVDARKMEIEHLKRKNYEFAEAAWEEREKVKKWQGISLKLNWLIEEMEKIGAIRLPDHEWATDMRESIEYPIVDRCDGGKSVFREISEDVRLESLPNYDDAHMEVVSEAEENRRYEEWTREAQEDIDISQHYIQEISAIKIQKIWRGWVARKAYRLAKEIFASAIYIQKIWRGYSSRDIKMYPGDILDVQDTIILGSLNLNMWKYKGGKKYPSREDLEKVAKTCFIGFYNTGTDEFTYEYCDADAEWDMGNTFAGIPATPKWPRIGVGPYSWGGSGHLPVYQQRRVGDWFVIRNISRGWKKMLRISQCNDCWFRTRYVDLNTGITFDPCCCPTPIDAGRINNILKEKRDELEAIIRIQALQRGRIVRQNVPPAELLLAIKEHESMMEKAMKRIGELQNKIMGKSKEERDKILENEYGGDFYNRK